MVANRMFTIILKEPTNINKSNPYVIYNNKKINARQLGKILGLKLDYGGTAFTVKDDLNEPIEVAQLFIDALENAFPKKKEYFNKVIAETFNNGYISINNITKRKTFIENYDRFKTLAEEIGAFGFWDEYKAQKLALGKNFWKSDLAKKVSEYFKWKGSIERDSKNFPIQGTAADMTKLAAIWIHREFKQRNLDAFIVNLIHDEIVVEAHSSVVEEAAKITQDCMERAGKVFCKTVPMVAIPDISDYWRKG